MKLWQKFSAIFFIGAMTIFLPSVSAGGDFNEGEAPPNDTPPINIKNTPKDKAPGGNENSGEQKKPDDNKTSDEQKKPDENKIPTAPPKDTQNIQNETFKEEEDFEENFNSGVLGDINNDGVLNAIDLVVLQKYLKGDAWKINEAEADINGDGTISNFDVFALLNLIKAEKKGTGDVNNDGKVDIYDVQALTEYLANPSTKINVSNADLTGDGRIGTDDLKILKGVISELQQ